MHLESLNNAFRDVVLRVKIHVYSKSGKLSLYTLIQSLCYSHHNEIKEFAKYSSGPLADLHPCVSFQL